MVGIAENSQYVHILLAHADSTNEAGAFDESTSLSFQLPVQESEL